MGTNYYLLLNHCKKCRRADRVHIGKASSGWTFSFQATTAIRSAAQWKEEIKKGHIRDEYGQTISEEEFWTMVEQKKNERRCHAKELPQGSFLDNEGNSFSTYEFT